MASFDFSILTIDGFREDIVDGMPIVIITGGDFSSLEEVIVDPDETVADDEIIAFIAQFNESSIILFKPDGMTEASFVVKTTLGAELRSEKYVFE